MTPALQALRLKEAETTGTLIAIVFGILVNHDHNLEITEKQWTRLRETYDARQAACNATTDLLCGGENARPLRNG